MTSSPLISFITVTYQAVGTLAPTLERILEQDVTDYECVVVDGGSTDGTVDLITSFADRFYQKGVVFRWVSEPDKGLYDAMNKGLAIANGQYVWFMNAGDRLANPDTLAGVISQIDSAHPPKNKPAGISATAPDFLYGETTIIDENQVVLGSRRLKVPQKLTWKQFRWGMLVCHQSMVVKKEVAPSFNTNYRFSADYDWAIRCLKASTTIVHTHLVLSQFRTGGLTSKRMKASLKERFRIMVDNYGLASTVLLHGWFVMRAGWFKLRHGWM